MNKIKVVTLFSGVGMQEKGIRLGDAKANRQKTKILAFAEICPIISDCYRAVHKNFTIPNIGNVKTAILKTSERVDCVISSFPCQDFSEIGARSIQKISSNSLLYASLTFIKAMNPRVVIFENVPGIQKYQPEKIIKKHLPHYTYVSNLLNSKDVGSPQNRLRWFAVCFRNDQPSDKFEWPKVRPPKGLRKTVEDVIDNTVVDRPCLPGLKPVIEYLRLKNSSFEKKPDQILTIFDGKKSGYLPTAGFMSSRLYSIKGLSPTVTKTNVANFYEVGGRLTARERWRLMGMQDDDFDRASQVKGASESKLSEMAGNGISVLLFAAIWNAVVKVLMI
jgi:DNA (cytosine-5)-methyltransferase 1